MTAELISRVRLLVATRRIRQQALAEFCGYSQAHISKVLSGKAALSGPLAARFEAWLRNNEPAEAPTSEEIEALVTGFAAASPDRRVHILHILKGLSALV